MRLSAFLVLAVLLVVIWASCPELSEDKEREELLDKCMDLDSFDFIDEKLKGTSLKRAKEIIFDFLVGRSTLDTGPYPRFFKGLETSEAKIEDLIRIQKRAEVSIDGGRVLTFPIVNSILKISNPVQLEKVKETVVRFGLYRLIFKSYDELNVILGQEYQEFERETIMENVQSEDLDSSLILHLLLRQRISIFKANPQVLKYQKEKGFNFLMCHEFSTRPTRFLFYSSKLLNPFLEKFYAGLGAGKPPADKYLPTESPNDPINKIPALPKSFRLQDATDDEIRATQVFVKLHANSPGFQEMMADLLLAIDDFWATLKFLFFKDFSRHCLSVGNELPWLQRFPFAKVVLLQWRVNDSLFAGDICTIAEAEAILGQVIIEATERAQLSEFLLKIAATHEIFTLSNENLKSLGRAPITSVDTDTFLLHLKKRKNFELKFLLSAHALLKKRLTDWEVDWESLSSNFAYIDAMLLEKDIVDVDEVEVAASKKFLEGKIRSNIFKLPEIKVEIDQTFEKFDEVEAEQTGDHVKANPTEAITQQTVDNETLLKTPATTNPESVSVKVAASDSNMNTTQGADSKETFTFNYRFGIVAVVAALGALLIVFMFIQHRLEKSKPGKV